MLEVPEEAVEAPVAPETPAAPARRGRTALLVAGAAVLGVVAGACTGYLIQADREPTKLPPLSQPELGQAKGRAPEPLSAAQDRQVRSDGDLRKLLLKKPDGAKAATWLTGEDGWMDMAEYADTYTRPAPAFRDLADSEFRRAAVTGWKYSSTADVEIRLVQYRQLENTGAADSNDNEQYWADAKPRTESWSVPGTGDGMAYVHRTPHTEAGYLPEYNAEAYARRGDIAMEIFVWDTKPVPKAKIMDLAKRQMERL